MKNIFIILLLSLTLFTQGFAQDVAVKRGDYKELTFSITGDVSNTYLSFVVKLTRDRKAMRLIWKRNLLAGGSNDEMTATYTSPKTTITVKLLPEDTDDFNSKSFQYDIESTLISDSNRVTTIALGRFDCLFEVQSPLDGLNLAADGLRHTTWVLGNGTIQNETIIWDTTLAAWKPSGSASSGGGSAGLFEPDGNGDLMPNDAIVEDTYYELDGNGDIQPI